MPEATKKAIHKIKKAINDAIANLEPEEAASVAHDVIWNLQRLIEQANARHKEK